MGLDHGLVRRKKPEDTELVTWRKEWWLRERFAECLHRFQDNGDTKVQREDLETLDMDIQTVLDEPNRADQFFPTWERTYNGEFFAMLRQLQADIRDIIDGTDWEKEDIYYWEWY